MQGKPMDGHPNGVKYPNFDKKWLPNIDIIPITFKFRDEIFKDPILARRNLQGQKIKYA